MPKVVAMPAAASTARRPRPRVAPKRRPLRESGIRWERIGSMKYTWSDRDEENTPGEVTLEACRGTVRLTIRPSRADRSEYLAAMREDALHRLISLIKSSIIV